MNADGIEPPWAQALRHVSSLSTDPALDPSLRVTLNFHPDRHAGGRPILAALAKDGVYLSQFVTGTSNGGLTAHPGGDRWRWESQLFAGAYDNASGHQRPVYGSLNFRHKPFGGSPRFGSAHLRLTAETLTRTTFCYPDSAAEPHHVGTAERMSLIELARADTRDALDDYIEAHVHAPVHLERHVEALVLDPSYRGTEIEATATRLPCPVRWHAGFRLATEELRRHPHYRGRQFVDLGIEIAIDGILDPRIIGDAARTGRYDPQSLKRVWHCLARFGAPDATSDNKPAAEPPDAPAQLQIHQIVTSGSNLEEATARCLTGTVRPGDRFERILHAAETIDLALVEIRRYPNSATDLLDSPHAAQVTLTGPGSRLLRPGNIIQITSRHPETACTDDLPPGAR